MIRVRDFILITTGPRTGAGHIVKQFEKEIAELSEKCRRSVGPEIHVQTSFDEKLIVAARAVVAVVVDIYRDTCYK